MAGPLGAAISLSDLLLLPALIGYTIWWLFDLRKGTHIRRWTLGLHIIVYGLAAFYIWAVSLGEIVLAGATTSALTWVWTIVLTSVGIAAMEVGSWYGERRIVLERGARGGWRYRGPMAIAILWLGLYLTRFGLEDGLLSGYSVFLPTGAAPSDVPLGTFIGVVLVVASLYLVSFGFLLGISLAVWGHHRRANLVSVPSAGDPGGAPGGRASSPPAGSVAPSTSMTGTAGFVGAGSVSASSPSVVPVLSATPNPVPLGPLPEPWKGTTEQSCPNCGFAWTASMAFCGGCGRPVPLPRPQGR